MKTPFPGAILLLLAGLAGMFDATAASFTWDGGSLVDSNWSTAANWLPDGAPPGDGSADLTFTGASRNSMVVTSNWSVRSITFSNSVAANPFTTTGAAQTITLGSGGIVNNDGDTQTFNIALLFIPVASTQVSSAAGLVILNCPLNFGASSNVLNTSGNVTVNGNITGQGTVNKTGTGTLTLGGTGDNRSYDLIAGGGTVTFAHSGTAAFNSSGSIALNSGTLNINGDLVLDNSGIVRESGANLNIAAGKTLTIRNGGTATIKGGLGISGGTLTLQSSGTTLSADTPLWLQSGGTLNVTSGASASLAGYLNLAATGASSNLLVDAASLVITSPVSSSIWGGTGGTANVTMRNNASATFGLLEIAQGTGAGTSANVLIDTGADLQCGNLNLATGAGSTAGMLTLTGNGSTVTQSGASTLTIGSAASSNAILNLSNSGTFTSGTGAITINKTGRVNQTGGNFNANGNLTIEGQFSHGSGGFTLATGKTLTVQNGGSASFTGARGFGNNISVTGTSSLLSATGALSLNNVTSVSGGGRISSDYGIRIGNAAGSAVSVTGNGSSFNSVGSGGLTLGDSTYGGSLSFSNGAGGTLGTVWAATGSGGASALLEIQSGATVTADNINANSGTSTVTTIRVSGTDSVLTQAGASTLDLGGASLSAATLRIEDDGEFHSGTGTSTVRKTGRIEISNGAYQANGSLTLDAGQLTCTGVGTFSLAAGKSFNIQNDGDARFSQTQSFDTAATINVSGGGSTLVSDRGLLFGGGSSANISAGGSASCTYFWIGDGGNGTVTVDGVGSSFGSTSATDLSDIGLNGATGSLVFRNGATGTLQATALALTTTPGSAGNLSVQNGADVTIGNIQAAVVNADVSANLTVTGSGSTLTQGGSSFLNLGATDTSEATFTVSSGGVFTSGTGSINIGATGTCNIDGGTFHANGNVAVYGELTRTVTGVINIASGKSFSVASGGSAAFTGPQRFESSHTVSVSGSGSVLSTTGGELKFGGGSTASVTSGGTISTQNLMIATSAGSGSVTVDGSSLSSTSLAYAAYIGQTGGTGSLTFSNNSTGTLHALNIDNSATVGTSGTLLIQSGSDVTTDSLVIAPSAAANSGSVTVTGAGSTLSQNGNSSLSLGAVSLSTGTFTVANAATFTSGSGETTVRPTGAIQITGGIYHANGTINLIGGQLNRDASGVFHLAAGRTFTVMSGGQANFDGSQEFSTLTSQVVVTGGGSNLAVDGILSFGGRSTARILAGATASCSTLDLRNGDLAVAGTGSSLTSPGGASAGFNGGLGVLDFSDSGSATLGTLWLGVDDVEGTSGTLVVRGGAAVTAGSIQVATSDTDSTAGTLTVTGSGSTLSQAGSADTILGAAHGSVATMTVANGGSFTGGTGGLVLNPTGSLLIDGGTVALNGPVAQAGGTLTFTSGSLAIVDDFLVGDGGLLGEAPVFTASLRFATTGTTTIAPFETLTLDGGRFATGALVNEGTLDFRRGTLAITGAGGLTIGGSGPLGGLTVIDGDSILEVTETATVQGGAGLLLDGTLQAGTLAILTGGRVTVRDGTGRISGNVANAGLLTGEGIVAGIVANSSAGEIRAAAGETLVLTGTNLPNAGRVNLQGGTIEFGQALANSATGIIQGRGTAHFQGGLVNLGAMNFSAGTTDLHGNISLTGTSARLISSGAGTVTVYDDFDHHGAEVRTGAGCNTVFFGDVTGPGPYTGTGTVYYEGSFSPGSSPANVTFGGDLVCGGSLVTMMELGGLARGSQYDAIQVAGDLTLDGTLALSLINGFQPVAGNWFDLFDWGTLTGTFDVLDLPALAEGLTWETGELYTTGSLAVVGVAPAGLSASPQAGLTVHLQWSDTTPAAPGFELQRALDAGFTSGLHSVTLPAGQTSYDDSDLTPETTFHYRVRALTVPTPSAFSTSAQAETPDRLADWRWVHFGNPDPVGDGEDLLDPDHDGASNLLEYACNLDPMLPDARPLAPGGSSGVPVAGRAPDGRLRLTFLRRTTTSLPAVTQGVVFSDNLLLWAPEPAATTVVESIDSLWERVTLTDPAAPAARRFVRTVVAAVPH